MRARKSPAGKIFWHRELRVAYMKRKQRAIRAAFICAACLLWIVAAGALLETAAMLHQIRMEHANPFIAAYRAGHPMPQTGTPLKVEPVPAIIPARVAGWDGRPAPFEADPSMERVFEWAALDSRMKDGERAARREAFAGLSPEARETYARLGKEMIIAFGQGRRMLAVYGSDKFLFEGIQRLLLRAVLFRKTIVQEVYAAVDNVCETGTSRSFSLYWPNAEAAEAILAAACIPAPKDKEPEAAYVFVDLNPDDIALGPLGQLPEDSRWLNPHFRFKPNYSGAAHPGFTTNRLGFRDAERDVPKPAGVFRIVCIGGSTTQEGDTNDSTYPALLESRLREAFPGRVVEVIDAGIPGIATPTHLLRFSEYAALEPDLVIMHLGVNDTLLKYNTWLVNFPASRLRSARMFFPSLLAPSPECFIRFHREYMGKNMELMTLMFQRRGAAVAFASIAWPDPRSVTVHERRYYDYQGHYTWEFPAFSLDIYAKYIHASNDMVKNLAASLDAAYIPVAESLHGGAELFTDFCHMTQTGIAAKAEIMFNAIHPLVQRGMGEAPDVPDSAPDGSTDPARGNARVPGGSAVGGSP